MADLGGDPLHADGAAAAEAPTAADVGKQAEQLYHKLAASIHSKAIGSEGITAEELGHGVIKAVQAAQAARNDEPATWEAVLRRLDELKEGLGDVKQSVVDLKQSVVDLKQSVHQAYDVGIEAQNTAARSRNAAGAAAGGFKLEPLRSMMVDANYGRQPGGLFPATTADVWQLPDERLNQLEAFYGQAFGDKNAENATETRRLAFQRFICGAII